jgi:hypothetical protein
MHDRRRSSGALLILVAAAGCGTTVSAPLARPQTVALDWRENCGTRADPILITTRTVIVRERRWRVELSFRNGTRVTLGVIRPDHPGETLFGLEPFETAAWSEVLERAETDVKPRTIADRFNPALPRLLSPGEAWSGWFAGSASLPAGTPIRVVLGRFVVTEKVPPGLARGFLCISKQVVRLK